MSGIGSMTQAVSVTMADIKDVGARIHADLYSIRARHPALLDDQRRQNLASDLEVMMYRNVISRIDFNFIDARTGVLRRGVRYDLTRAWAGGRNDDSGGLGTFDSTGMRFVVQIQYTAAFRMLPVQAQNAFLKSLLAGWGPMAEPPRNGSFTQDRVYGHGVFGAERSVYRES